MSRKKRKADYKIRKAAIFETNTSTPYSEPRDLLEEVVELEQVRPELIEAVALGRRRVRELLHLAARAANLTGLVLGCIEAEICKKIFV